jgi:ABC-type multidrug transport system fused ATPase/permease subunit
MENRGKTSTFTIIKQLFGFFSKTKLHFSFVLFLVLAANLLELIRPKIIGGVIDNITASSSIPSQMAHIALIGGLTYLAAALGSSLLTVVFGLTRIRLEQTIVSDLQLFSVPF